MNKVRNDIKKSLLDAIGHEPDYWVRINGAGWCDKGVLTPEDYDEIKAALGDDVNTQTVENSGIEK